MSKKRKIALLVCCVILLLPILYIAANALFVTVEVFSGGSTYALRGYGMITLYNNRMLIESKVNWRAENNGFVRLFQIPQRVRVLPKEDYKRVLELVDVLAKNESDISPEIAGISLRMCIIAGSNHHYIIPFVYGTPEAVELHQILYSCLYSKELSSRTYK